MKARFPTGVTGDPRSAPPSLCRKNLPSLGGSRMAGMRVGEGEAGAVEVLQEVLLPGLSAHGANIHRHGWLTLGQGAPGASGHAACETAPASVTRSWTLSASHAGQQAVPSTSQRNPVLGPLLQQLLEEIQVRAATMMSEKPGSSCPSPEPRKTISDSQAL